jgi:LmbE family N-acetylglucosaminyl deacetylase
MTPEGGPLAVPTVALAVGAHPDDVEFGCGATLAKWAAAGCRIHHLVCTDGSKGSWDPDEDTALLVTTRQAEQRRASVALGGRGEVTFLGWPDGELESGVRQRWQVAYHIRRLRPDVVLGHDPWKRYRLHPDHRHAGFLVTDGIVAARDPHFFPEQAISPHRPSALLLFEADAPDYVEDVTGYEEAKLAALLAHRSQFRSTMGINDSGSNDGGISEARKTAAGTTDDTTGDEIGAFRARVLERLTATGGPAGFTSGEAFRLMTDL